MKHKRMVIKLGTGILSVESGLGLDFSQFTRLGDEIAQIKSDGWDVVLVSSGAVAAGVSELGLKERPGELAEKQACAAIGQCALMRAYHKCLSSSGLLAAQLLLSHDDIDSRLRRNNAKRALERLLRHVGVIPIVNENDCVAVEELRFGDNDRLSAEVAALAGADLLVILTGVDGLLDKTGAVVPEILDIEAGFSHVTEETGRFSVGGMKTKLEAARIARECGIPTLIANGRTPGILPAVAGGVRPGTFFPVA